jgi:hypothetical protein
MYFRFWAAKAIKFLLLAAVLTAVIGFVVMSMWNALIPAIFHAPFYITFPQAIGLFVLSKLLFGGFRGGGWGRRGYGPPAFVRQKMRAKMERRLATMTDEQRAEFRARMAQCGPRWAAWTGHQDEAPARPAAE